MVKSSKYARVEWERRFLLREFPQGATVTQVRSIEDRYIEGTNLRLRKMTEVQGQAEFKLTQKLPESGTAARQGLITTMYVSRDEFDVLARLPSRSLTKTRHSLAPFGVDVFDGQLRGLLLAEAEFSSVEEASALILPSFLTREISHDLRFTGGSLVRASRVELASWLVEFGITLHVP